MATSTPWATEHDGEPLRLVAAAPTVGARAIHRRFRAVPLRWRSARRWVPVADIGVIVATLSFVTRSSGSSDLDAGSAVIYALTWCVALGITGAWTSATRTGSRHAVGVAAALVGLASWVTEALVDPAVAPRELLALTVALALAVLIPRQLLVAAVGARPPVRIAVAGDIDVVRRVLPELRKGTRPRWDVLSVCVSGTDTCPPNASSSDALPAWVGSAEVVHAAVASRAQAVLIAPGPSLDPWEVRRLTWAAHDAGLEVYIGTGLLDVVPRRANLVCSGAANLVRLDNTDAPSAARVVKAVADRVGAALLLAAFLPLLGAIAVAVRVDSSGPIIFRQQRIGRHGRPFTMYKFRTMVVDAPAERATLSAANECDGVLFKVRQDPRVTGIGALLRRYSLDELPQLVNVLCGQMSLVGPRPALPDEADRYDEDPRRRLTVKPGLTGLWQVSGRSDLTWDEAVRLDLHYVDNWSLGLDLRILLRTFSAVLGHRGAY